MKIEKKIMDENNIELDIAGDATTILALLHSILNENEEVNLSGFHKIRSFEDRFHLIVKTEEGGVSALQAVEDALTQIEEMVNDFSTQWEKAFPKG